MSCGPPIIIWSGLPLPSYTGTLIRSHTSTDTTLGPRSSVVMALLLHPLQVWKLCLKNVVDLFGEMPMAFTPSKDFRRPSIPQRDHRIARVLRLNYRRNLFPVSCRPDPLKNREPGLFLKSRTSLDAAVTSTAIRVNASSLLRDLVARHILKRDLVATCRAVSKTGVIYDLVHPPILRL